MGDVVREISSVAAPGLSSLLGDNPLGSVGDFLGTNTGKTNVSGFGPSSGEIALSQALMNQYNGTGGPSAAERQMTAGLGHANSNAMALAAAQRGVSPALAAQMAQMAQAQNSQNVVQNAGILRAQEAMGAAGNLAGMFGSQRQSAGQANALSMQGDQAALGRRMNVLSSMGSSGSSMMQGGGGGAAGGGAGGTAMAGGAMDAGGMAGPAMMMANQGGMVPGYAQGGQIHPEIIAFAHKIGEMASQNALNMKSGGPVPGQAAVPGDSIKNDTVPAMLSPGEVVIPRTIVAQGPEAMMHFAMALSRKGAA